MAASSTVVSAGGRRRVDRPAVDTRGCAADHPKCYCGEDKTYGYSIICKDMGGAGGLGGGRVPTPTNICKETRGRHL